MKFKGLIKLSANKGTVFVKQLWKGEWDCKSSFVKYNKKEIQITDCESTFNSAINNCILAKEKVSKNVKSKTSKTK